MYVQDPRMSLGPLRGLVPRLSRDDGDDGGNDADHDHDPLW